MMIDSSCVCMRAECQRAIIKFVYKGIRAHLLICLAFYGKHARKGADYATELQ